MSEEFLYFGEARNVTVATADNQALTGTAKQFSDNSYRARATSIAVLCKYKSVSPFSGVATSLKYGFFKILDAARDFLSSTSKCKVKLKSIIVQRVSETRSRE